MQMILYQMTTDGNMDFEHLYDVSPWCRHSAFNNCEMRSVGSRRIVKTHDEYERLKDIKKGKFIFVIRDCLDVISSLYAHLLDYGYPINDFAELSGRKMKEWFAYNTKWLKNEHCLDIMYICYEDLIADKKAIVAKMADFLNIALDDDITKRVIDRTSFDFMKMYESKFGEQPDRKKVYNNFIRNGKAGDGKSKFSAEQLQQYNSLMQEYAAGNMFLNRYNK